MSCLFAFVICLGFFSRRGMEGNNNNISPGTDGNDKLTLQSRYYIPDGNYANINSNNNNNNNPNKSNNNSATTSPSRVRAKLMSPPVLLLSAPVSPAESESTEAGPSDATVAAAAARPEAKGPACPGPAGADSPQCDLTPLADFPGQLGFKFLHDLAVIQQHQQQQHQHQQQAGAMGATAGGQAETTCQLQPSQG